jgi:hypothetical protein
MTVTNMKSPAHLKNQYPLGETKNTSKMYSIYGKMNSSGENKMFTKYWDA